MNNRLPSPITDKFETTIDLGECGEYCAEIVINYTQACNGSVINGLKQEPDYPEEVEILEIILTRKADGANSELSATKIPNQLWNKRLVDGLKCEALEYRSELLKQEQEDLAEMYFQNGHRIIGG